MPEPQIFKATYSGVPVYEMMVKTIAVMRRRADGWLNATQILKVAGFDKPQRTRVLEREVQKGEHEKVQGGYGKYQGTWVPPERGLALARQYNCDNAIRLIIDFIPNDRSPPPAPKHSTAQPSKAKREAAAAAAAGASNLMTTRSSNRRILNRGDSRSPSRASEDGTMTASPSGSSASSRTPSPIRDVHMQASAAMDVDGAQEPSAKKRKRREGETSAGRRDARAYSDQILEYFISDSNQTPRFLVSPPLDYDPNVPIDDDQHTALHWASAMGRIKIVKLLLTAGADVFRINKSGQTALMRSVMFANNYDIRKFPELYELLHRSTLNIDNNNRTVFHHIIDVAMSKGKTHAARYYMETILNRLADYPTELADIINFQDEDGETALTLAARCRSKRLVKLLIDHGADPKLTNRDGKSAEDYILEDERFRFSPTLPSRAATTPYRNNPAFSSISNNSWNLVDKPPLHHSVIAQRASTKVVSEVSTMLNNLATSFDRELLEKERDLNQAHALLANIDAEIVESQRTVVTLKSQASAVDEAKGNMEKLEDALATKMSKRHRLGWEKWVKDEEIRGCELFDEHGKLIGEITPENKDIADLYAKLPEEPVQMHEECERLRSELTRLRRRRREGFDSLVKQLGEAGTGGKMNEYKRLIASGCGGLSSADVDHVIDTLLETMQTEEVTASVSWVESNMHGKAASSASILGARMATATV